MSFREIPTARWFGSSWGAPICDEADHAPTPIDEPCMRCERPIVDGDRGLLVAHLDERVIRQRPWHLDCWLENIGARQREED